MTGKAEVVRRAKLDGRRFTSPHEWTCVISKNYELREKFSRATGKGIER